MWSMASMWVRAAFAGLPALLVVVTAWGIATAWRHTGADRNTARRAGTTALAAGAAWMMATALVAVSGVLRQWDWVPPPFALVPVLVLAGGAALALSPVGRRLASGVPLAALVGVQAFRLPLELAMHRASADGIVPAQMTFAGQNFDIVSGITALALGAALTRFRVPRSICWGWNVLGLVLLVNILQVAIRSIPPIAAYGPDRLNTFVTYPPFVWLPAIMVLAAWTGHLVVFRALRTEGVSPSD